MSPPPSFPPRPESIDIDALWPPFAPDDASTDWLFRLQRLGIRPGLTAMGEWLEALGHPERAFPSIVVAGTNGKGTAAIALAELGRSAGLRTALYTSPHLLKVNERIVVDGAPIAPSVLAALIDEHRDTIEDLRTTFFESLTGLALLHFAREGVELAVLETGLGGRLDATNVVRKAGLVLTSVGLDHMELLGPDVESIAREKLGLAEPGVPFYLDALDPSVNELAHRILGEVGAEPIDLGELRDRTGVVVPESIPLAGQRQRRQVAKMIAAYEDLARRHGWPAARPSEAVAALRAPGRYDVRGSSPRLVLDTAHNEQALMGLAAQWSGEGERDDRILVLALMGDKRAEAALPALLQSSRTVLVTAPRWYRARPATHLADELREVAVTHGIEVTIETPGTVREALEEARRRAAGRGRVLVAGSNFLVAEALDRLGVDDLFAPTARGPWDEGEPLRRRRSPAPKREVA